VPQEFLNQLTLQSQKCLQRKFESQRESNGGLQ
jgi:hypothetical protein